MPLAFPATPCVCSPALNVIPSMQEKQNSLSTRMNDLQSSKSPENLPSGHNSHLISLTLFQFLLQCTYTSNTIQITHCHPELAYQFILSSLYSSGINLWWSPLPSSLPRPILLPPGPSSLSLSDTCNCCHVCMYVLPIYKWLSEVKMCLFIVCWKLTYNVRYNNKRENYKRLYILNNIKVEKWRVGGDWNDCTTRVVQ